MAADRLFRNPETSSIRQQKFLQAMTDVQSCHTKRSYQLFKVPSQKGFSFFPLNEKVKLLWPQRNVLSFRLGRCIKYFAKSCLQTALPIWKMIGDPNCYPAPKRKTFFPIGLWSYRSFCHMVNLLVKLPKNDRERQRLLPPPFWKNECTQTVLNWVHNFLSNRGSMVCKGRESKPPMSYFLSNLSTINPTWMNHLFVAPQLYVYHTTCLGIRYETR